ncbi:pilus assembly protein [Burkholderia pyrrocinia]|uniref:pilus assembly protein n=1 Tax=Burkholderia pyrrocinia TaxID=60550 RepID=UPI00104C3F53|nr:pilus assembly protein [Burkholderia pyrrocinia]TDA47471.1 pilus assembly protein [Burkholderia pyrrocinia]
MTKKQNERHESGQAMVEMAVGVAMVFGVLFVGIVMLAKFNDARNKTLMGARYATWERTVWLDPDKGDNSWYRSFAYGAQFNMKDDANVQNEIVQRITVGASVPVQSSDGSNAGTPETMPVMWRDPSGGTLVNERVNMTAATNEIDGPYADYFSTNHTFGTFNGPNGSVITSGLKVTNHTGETAQVSMSIGQDNAFLKRLWPGFSGLTFSDQGMLLTNAWVPDGSGRVTTMIGLGHAVPVSLIPGVLISDAELKSEFATHFVYLDTLQQIERGKIAPDVVPSGVLR